MRVESRLKTAGNWSSWSAVNSAPWHMVLGVLPVGSYQAEFRGIDNRGAVSDVSVADFTVVVPPEVKKFAWSKSEVLVGESVSLSWDFEGVTSCSALGDTASRLDLTGKNMLKDSVTTTFYQVGSFKARRSCNGLPAPVEASVEVRKLPAPTNLTSK